MKFRTKQTEVDAIQLPEAGEPHEAFLAWCSERKVLAEPSSKYLANASPGQYQLRCDFVPDMMGYMWPGDWAVDLGTHRGVNVYKDADFKARFEAVDGSVWNPTLGRWENAAGEPLMCQGTKP